MNVTNKDIILCKFGDRNPSPSPYGPLSQEAPK